MQKNHKPGCRYVTAEQPLQKPAYSRLYDEDIPPHPFEDFTERTGWCLRCGEAPDFHLHAVTTAVEKQLP